jgi:hypothetical protein
MNEVRLLLDDAALSHEVIGAFCQAQTSPVLLRVSSLHLLAATSIPFRSTRNHVTARNTPNIPTSRKIDTTKEASVNETSPTNRHTTSLLEPASSSANLRLVQNSACPSRPSQRVHSNSHIQHQEQCTPEMSNSAVVSPFHLEEQPAGSHLGRSNSRY